MKHIFFATAILTLMAQTGWSQNYGPGEGGSVLKDPSAPVSPQVAPSSKIPYVEQNHPSGNAPSANPLASKLQALASPEINTLNDDIKIAPSHGPFAIFIQCYTGEDCHQLARNMVIELRSSYKLAAYTFNKGAEEKRKEYARVTEVIEKKREQYRKNGVPENVPIRVGFMNIQEQCAVILGGYSSEASARRALDGIRQLKPLDPAKVMLDKKVFYAEDKSSKTEKLQEGFVNPFLGAFVAHNPTIKQERPADWDKPDIGLLEKLNANEPYSLLKCKKQFTLVVKEFQMPTIVQTKNSAASVLDSLSFGGKANQREDAAAKSAHHLAEGLRKAKFEAYVLHTKYSSIVCVGGYDSIDEPAMNKMAKLMETKILPDIFQLSPRESLNPSVPQFRVMPLPIPR